MSSLVRKLPLVRWASRFRHGTVRLTGRVSQAVTLPSDPELAIGPGPVSVSLRFEGGGPPRIVSGALRGVVSIAGVAGRRLEWTGVAVELDGRSISISGVPRALDTLLDHLHDLGLDVEAQPAGELLVKVGHGVRATVPPCGVVTLRGTSVGPPGSLRLAGPVSARVGGEGVAIGHDRLPWLLALAKVRIGAATLQPDGEVALTGRGRRALRPIVGKGLRSVSGRISVVVRHSPRFERVRTFLRPTR